MMKKILMAAFVVTLTTACPFGNKKTHHSTMYREHHRPSNEAQIETGEMVALEENRLEDNLKDKVWFDFDSSSLTSEAKDTLDKQAEWMKSNPLVKVKIEGHADARGTEEYNLGLGMRRANAVQAYLVSLGVEENRLETISYGKERPAVLGSGEEIWKQNRRAVSITLK